MDLKSVHTFRLQYNIGCSWLTWLNASTTPMSHRALAADRPNASTTPDFSQTDLPPVRWYRGACSPLQPHPTNAFSVCPLVFCPQFVCIEEDLECGMASCTRHIRNTSGAFVEPARPRRVDHEFLSNVNISSPIPPSLLQWSAVSSFQTLAACGSTLASLSTSQNYMYIGAQTGLELCIVWLLLMPVYFLTSIHWLDFLQLRCYSNSFLDISNRIHRIRHLPQR